MEILALLPSAFEIFSQAESSGAIKEILVFLVAWGMVKKEMVKQFKVLSESLKEMSETVKGLSETMLKVEARHNGRLNNLERDVYHINEKLSSMKVERINQEKAP